MKHWCSIKRYSLLPVAIAISIGSGYIAPKTVFAGSLGIAQSSLCPSPALSRIQTHQVAAGETLEGIAASYNLLPVTLLGMNPSFQPDALTSGTMLRIPPFNGIEVSVPEGTTWDDLATTYQLRADILFEVNGCPETMPSRIFVPGVNWFPGIESAELPSAERLDNDPLTGYPLSEPATIVMNFGWQPHPDRDELIFSNGVTLDGAYRSTVLAVGEGTVAYVGEEDTFGTLIVINHAQGFQTRYAYIRDVQVNAGDRVSAGQTIASALPNADPVSAMLYFEVRTNSALGWVARDPGDYIPALAVR
ncbi:MAG: M23 family metallopeptidase [Leptolyngbya sp. SIO1D8]|nr:M23 family metallopeptidase [Leptolyngbya sp. SIO1D8]